MKYYWLKIKKDFYKRHDIKVIESMPNGVEYIWFYLKLMMESVDHEGLLRFNEYIPYDDRMLSTILNTNIDIVRGAMKVFHELNMIEILDDQTIYIDTVAKMIGSESESAERVRKHREKKIEIKELPEPKELKKKYGEYNNVTLTDADYSRLQSDFTEDSVNMAITFLDAYIEEKGYKSKNHNLAIRRWVMDAIKDKTKKYGKVNRVEMPMDYPEAEIPNEIDVELVKASLRSLK